MPFIPPMLCSRLENQAGLADRRYIAEPNIDGQRAQVHAGEGRAVACYSRPGHDLLRHPGMAWLRMVVWPMENGGRLFQPDSLATSSRAARTALQAPTR